MQFRTVKQSGKRKWNDMKERNRCLDFWKGVSAIGVIFVHIMFPGSFGKLMCAVGSCGVLLFFIISGYAAHGGRETVCPKLLARFRRNLLLTLAAIPAYLLATWFEVRSTPGGNWYFLKSAVKKPLFYFRLLLLGDLDIIHGDPLWFMFALLYGYLVFWLINRFGWQKIACRAMPFFILLRIGMVTYKNTTGADWHMCSNVLVSALPMMLLGYVIAEKEEKVRGFSDKAVILSCLLSAASVAVTVLVKPAGYDVSAPFKIWAAASVFVLTLKKPSQHIFRPVEKVGRDYSLHVYLWHMPLLIVFYIVFDEMHMSQKFFSWVLPLITVAAAGSSAAQRERARAVRQRRA